MKYQLWLTAPVSVRDHSDFRLLPAQFWPIRASLPWLVQGRDACQLPVNLRTQRYNFNGGEMYRGREQRGRVRFLNIFVKSLPLLLFSALFLYNSYILPIAPLSSDLQDLFIYFLTGSKRPQNDVLCFSGVHRATSSIWTQRSPATKGLFMSCWRKCFQLPK